MAGNPEKIKASARAWRLKHRQSARDHMRHKRETLRAQLFQVYGKSCAVCGEADEMLLDLDHVAGGGSRERAKTGSNLPIWQRAIKENDPTKWRILCKNHNWKAHRMRRELFSAAQRAGLFPQSAKMA